MKYILIILLVLSLSYSIAAPALAIDLCRNVGGHRLCIISIERSAKNYLEYRTKVEIDGKKQVREIYNCRDRTVTRKGEVAISFKTDSLGELVCDLFR